MIITSPLKRHLESAYLIFKEHPNFKNIEVVLDPNLRDLLVKPYDIPGPIQPTIDEFSKLFSKLNTSLLDLWSPDKDLWFLQNSTP